MAQGFASAFEKCLLAVGDTKCVGADDTHTVRVHVAQPLAETLEASNGARGDLFVDASVFFYARREANHLAQSIDNGELAVRVTRDDHVKAVGP